MDPALSGAIRHASEGFAAEVDALVSTAQGQEPSHRGGVSTRLTRRVCMTIMRYLLRAEGRPTPFGLFAGVAPAQVGCDPGAVWRRDHRLVVRADTLWLDGVIATVEQDAGVLTDSRCSIEVVANNLLVDRGVVIELARPPGKNSVHKTPAIVCLLELAARPVTAIELVEQARQRHPSATEDQVMQALVRLLSGGFLLSSLRAPMTDTDPLGWLIARLPADHALASELRGVRELLRQHNHPYALASECVAIRGRASQQMRALAPEARVVLAGDLSLDCRVTVPPSLAVDLASAASALLRMVRIPGPEPAWNLWCGEFWERYGTGSVVPVTEAVHPDRGLGYPAGYPGTLFTPAADEVTARDRWLLRQAQLAALHQQDEITLTDEMITEATGERPVDSRWLPPHLELAAQVRCDDADAIARGEYTFTVHPAWSIGTLTSRFWATGATIGLAAAYAALPPASEGAQTSQVSFAPLYPHGQNVGRIPQHLPTLISLGEFSPPEAMRIADLGIVAGNDGLHLVHMLTGQPIEPQVLHALDLEKQAPPLARFLTMLSRSFRVRLTEFDWGPATGLPFLPRVRYGRAILSPATWTLTSAELASDGSTGSATSKRGVEAVTRWREQARCPSVVELQDANRSLRLDLHEPAHVDVLLEQLSTQQQAALTETATHADLAWMAGHAHEIVMPFTRNVAPEPSAVRGPLPRPQRAPVQFPAAASCEWLYLQLFTHPERINDVLLRQLPALAARLAGRPLWFIRYRSPRQSDHLRIRIRLRDADDYLPVTGLAGAWADEVRSAGAAWDATFATYRPEHGRYGTGPALALAENLSCADSAAAVEVLQQLDQSRSNGDSPLMPALAQVLTAAGMVTIADAFHGGPGRATPWLLRHLADRAAPTSPRLAAQAVIHWARTGTLSPGGSPAPASLEADSPRNAAVAAYRQALDPAMDADHVLSSLLHVHHNRVRGVDRDDEGTCLRLARQAALARQAITS